MGNQQGNNFDVSYYLEEDSGFEGSSTNSSQNSSFDSNNQHSFINYLESVKEPLDNSSFNDYSDQNNDNNIVNSRVSKKGVVKSKSIGIDLTSRNRNNSTIIEEGDDEVYFDDIKSFDNMNHNSYLLNNRGKNNYSSSWSPNSNQDLKDLIYSNSNNNTNNTSNNSILIETEELKSPNNTPTETKQLSSSSSYWSLRNGMNFVGRLAKGVKEFYNEMNTATLTGAIDVIVVQQEDGTFKGSPFHVRFGKLGVIRSKEKIVDIEINGEPVDLHMELGDAGEAYFIEKLYDSQEDLSSTAITPASQNEKINSFILLSDNKDEPSSLKNSSSPIDILNNDKTIESPNSSFDESSKLMKIKDPDSVTLKNESDSASNKMTNFFSDGELTPELTSPAVSRPPTPKSDTELEMHKPKRQSISGADMANQWSWSWGQLPERQNVKKPAEPINESNLTEDAKNNKEQPTSNRLLGGMFSLIGPNKTNQPGIYLDDTEKLDSEVAALYLDQKSYSSKSTLNITQQKVNKDEDQESGRGQSLPQSPRDYYSILGDVQISLCGFITSSSSAPSSPKLPPSSSSSATVMNDSLLQPAEPSLISPSLDFNFDDLFQQYSVPFEKFIDEITTITSNPNLIFKINNKYMNWQTASPIILAAVVFHRQLPPDVFNVLADNSKSLTKTPTNQNWPNTNNTTSSTSSLKVAGTGTTTTGSGWGKNLLFWGKKTSDVSAQQSQPPQSSTLKPTETDNKNMQQIQVNVTLENSTVYNTQENLTKTNSISQELLVTNPIYETTKLKKEKYRKTTRLSSDQIMKLNLKPGPNEIKYSVTTALQGTTRIHSYIFLWNYDDKIIISDIDGTITKSDVWGQVLPIFGKDWTQAGVAVLFTAIQRNEYKFIYLSARAIGQSKLTRELLDNVNQEGFRLPHGPLLVTPTSLFTAFQKEVIEKKPEEFKINCLKDIQTLFPESNKHPYYAGYGNKSTDVVSYKAVGIPIPRIFTINPQGELKHEVSRSFQSSYSKLCEYVDLIFPPFKPQNAQVKSEYDSFHYWRDNFQQSNFMSEIENELKELTLKQTSKDGKSDKTTTGTATVSTTSNRALLKSQTFNNVSDIDNLASSKKKTNEP